MNLSRRLLLNLYNQICSIYFSSILNFNIVSQLNEGKKSLDKVVRRSPEATQVDSGLKKVEHYRQKNGRIVLHIRSFWQAVPLKVISFPLIQIPQPPRCRHQADRVDT